MQRCKLLLEINMRMARARDIARTARASATYL